MGPLRWDGKKQERRCEEEGEETRDRVDSGESGLQGIQREVAEEGGEEAGGGKKGLGYYAEG